ncbi:MAG: hypothetical protein ACOYT8_02210 [Candidatus Dependentiae bacterium]
MKYYFLFIVWSYGFCAYSMHHQVIVNVVNNTPMPVKIQQIGREQIMHIPGMETSHYYIWPFQSNNSYEMKLKISGDFFRSAYVKYVKKAKKNDCVIKKKLIRNSKKIKYKVWGAIYQSQKDIQAQNDIRASVINLIIDNNKKPIISPEAIILEPELAL